MHWSDYNFQKKSEERKLLKIHSSISLDAQKLKSEIFFFLSKNRRNEKKNQENEEYVKNSVPFLSLEELHTFSKMSCCCHKVLKDTTTTVNRKNKEKKHVRLKIVLEESFCEKKYLKDFVLPSTRIVYTFSPLLLKTSWIII